VRVVTLDPAPVLVASGVLTPLGPGVEMMARGTGAMRGGTVPGDLAALCGEPPLKLRRMDRYGALGFAAAHLAMRGAPRRPVEKGDPDWGVLVGSSQACWCSTAAHFRDLCGRAPIDLRPAVFARSVSNTVNGEVSIAHRIGGISETFISGWESGAEAIAAACAALAEGRARWILAGGVEAPEPVLTTLHDECAREAGMARLPATLSEGAGFCLLTSEAAAADPSSPVVLAFARSFDPHGRWSLAGAVDALWPSRIGAVIVANTVPPGLLDRWKDEAGAASVIILPKLTGEIGAAGGAVAMALAAAELSTGTLTTLGVRAGACVLVIARGAEGGTVALALGPGGDVRRS
jgi:3-oxoacyl-(acyl-carrier-protein) synthase